MQVLATPDMEQAQAQVGDEEVFEDAQEELSD